MAISDEAIEATRDFWQKRTGKPISREDAREAISNITAFFDLLHEWDSRDLDSSGCDEKQSNADA